MKRMYVKFVSRYISANAVKSEDESNDHFQRQISKVSFGALAKAQDALASKESGSRKRKRGEDTSAAQEDKLQALRERLRTLKAEKLAKGWWIGQTLEELREIE